MKRYLFLSRSVRARITAERVAFVVVYTGAIVVVALRLFYWEGI